MPCIRTCVIVESATHGDDHGIMRFFYLFSRFLATIALGKLSKRDRSEWTKKFRELLNKDGDAHNTFKLIEIELGLMYDMLLSKLKSDGHLKGDPPITIILLVGALCLEIGGALVQLGSDWAIVWACKHYPKPKSSKSVPNKVETTKILSYYMMHLLRFCPALPFCKNRENMDKFFEEEKSNGEKLARSLDEKGNSKWEIMSNMWVEMLCYAASCCSVEQHVQELRRGGQFLTHVWLLLMHSGATKKLEENASQQLDDKEDRESKFVDAVEGCCC
ncbi:hypothetical protein LOK49_LG02G01024 [Camellia lanceoleosa]|uniref:Uncharacterized protein n=1 Tax=Camellia lanceoleosa TaxID=1840588 RepID=A0ACC0IGL7_9ERIC|nr:hypothetical protein LOK49_LG02G01024 [Camellia lanceoleosa]